MELCASGHDKGDAVRTLVAKSGSEAVIAFLGDDHADEDAFRAIPDNGAAVLVSHALRPTAADLWLQPPGELLTFLRRWRAARRRS
jgi:trehalose-6-phosphatase